MRFYWVRDRHRQKQFHVHWKRGQENLADYTTKHHSAKHHISVRPTYVLNNLRRSTRLKLIPTISPTNTRSNLSSPDLHTITVPNESYILPHQSVSPRTPPISKHAPNYVLARPTASTQSHCKGVLKSIPVNGKLAQSQPLTSRYSSYPLQSNNDIANGFKRLPWKIPSRSQSRSP